jgi:tripartite-type tricarboxylate transporter receptor subunit TctC
MRQAIRAALLAALFAVAWPFAVDAYPEKTIKIVVGAPPGGGLDILARALAQELTARWGKAVIVENRGGASGLIAAEAVANAAPDGYTWLAATDQTYLSNRFAFKKLPYDPDGFANISIIAQADQFMLTTPDVQANSIRELVALDREKPDKLSYGSWGDGSTPQLLYETLNKDAGTKLLGVPYKGVAPVLNALGTGEIQLSVVSAGTAGSFLRAGRVKMLAIAARSRSPVFPEIPTTAEEGYPDLLAFIWFGLAAPRGTPTAIIDKANAEILDIARQPAFSERFITPNGWKLIASTPAEMGATIQAELPVIRKMIENAGVTPQ